MATWLPVLLIGVTACTVGEDPVQDSEADSDSGQFDEVVAVMSSNPEVPAGFEAATTDGDGDGIPDATEELLLRRYRPYYKFSQDGGKDEDFRPANPISELENAQLKIMNTDGTGTSDPICGRDGDHHLVPGESLFTCRPDADFDVLHAKSSYCLNIANDRYHGVSFADAKANGTGLYGHVTNTTINGHDAYKIEYWQFFAFNNQDITVLGLGSFGDHEGDWTSVQVWFDKVDKRLVKIRYLIHGKEALFDIPATSPSCKDCMIAVKGSSYNPNPGNFFSNVAAYSNNQAEFYIDDHRFKHVVVYIERGAHEFWPGAWGTATQSAGPFTFKLNPHNGAGPSYLVPDVKDRLYNMGEVDKPLTRAGSLITGYDGFWGCTNTKQANVAGPQRRSPIGPAIHCEWHFPDNSTVPHCEH